MIFKQKLFTVSVGAAWFALGSIAHSADPIALVEDISASHSNLQAMDYLFEGDVISLSAGENITISYMMSCAIEHIKGGDAKINIGRKKSNVTGKGHVKRKFVECGGVDISLTHRQSDAAAGVVVRGGKDKGSKQPSVTVYSRHPIIKLSNTATHFMLTELETDQTQRIAAKERNVDLANLNISLKPGGVYKISTGDKSVVFQIAKTARASKRNVISRMVEL